MATTQRIKVPPAFKGLSAKGKRYKVYYGGRGSGKSWACARVLLARGFERPIRILCAREIQKSISDSVHKLLSEQLEEMRLGGFYDITRDAIRGQNGTEFIFKGLRANPQEIKSMEGIDICWVEEAQAVSAESWDVLIPTIRKPGSEIWVTFNPLDEQDPTYQRFIVNPSADALVRKVNFDENPYFPDVLRKEMEWLKRRDYESYLHIWEGEVRKISNALVFGGRFRVEPFDTPNNARFYHGADWGFANDPTTLVRSFVDNGTLYIDAEAWGVGVEIDQTPQLFDSIDTARRWPIKADCARPETISYMRRQGFNVTAAKKWQGSIEDGIEHIKTYDIVVHPRCRHIIDEFNRYSYKVDKQTGDILPVIVDAYNHCLKGNTLVSCEDGDKPIKDVCAGDYVYTRKGLKKVLWSGKTRENARVFSVCADGYEVTGTADHKIFTHNRGWVAIGDIQEGDVLLCVSKPLRHTGKHGIDTQMLREGQTENTSRITQPGYTVTHGNRSVVLFLQEWLSIIKTVIAKTIALITLNVYHPKTTDSGTHGMMSNWKNSALTWLILGHLQSLGTKVLQAMNGISNTPRSSALALIRVSPASVSNAAGSLSLKSTIINSAPTPVKVHGEGRQGSMMLSAPVQCVARPLQSTNILKNNVVLKPVQCVKDGGIESAVYDLTVEDEHEFFANGVLVHNCIDALRYSLDGLIKGRGMMNINPKALTRPGYMRRG